jgi:EAL domain-containing protein (putative c-di-GMP-specific phosphodiesterase class I)
LIIPLGDWVIRTACAQLARWRGTNLDKLTIAVNVSSQQFHHGDLLNSVLRTVWDAKIQTSHIEIEITESLLMTDVEATMLILQAFKDAGCGSPSMISERGTRR